MCRPAFAWKTTRALVVLIFANLLPRCDTPTTDPEFVVDDHRFNVILREYVTCTGPDDMSTLVSVIDAATGKVPRVRRLQKFIAETCTITVGDNASSESLSLEQFGRHISRLWHSLYLDQLVLGDPVYTRSDDQVTVRFQRYVRSSAGTFLIETRLCIRSMDGHLQIVQINEKHRRPTPHEVAVAKHQLRFRKYNPRRGLGARYLGGGVFSGTHPRFSPDGKSICFASLRHESSEIYTFALETGQLLRLTHTPYWEFNLGFTSDGDEVLFLSDEFESLGSIWIMGIDGSRRRQLAGPGEACRSAVLSPDGRSIAVVCQNPGGTRSVWTKGPTDTGFEQRTPVDSDCYAVRFSTDSQRVAFVRRDRPSWSDSRLGTCLVSGRPSDVSWSAPGARSVVALVAQTSTLYYVAVDETYRNELRSFSIDDQVDERILSGGSLGGEGFVLSANGSTLYFVWDGAQPFEYEIYRLRLDGQSQPQRLTQERGYVSGIDLSPDGRDVLFLLQRKGAPSRGRGWICTVPSKGGKVRRICRND